MADRGALHSALDRPRRWALLIGAAGLAVWGLGFLAATAHQALLSYLFGYLVCLGLALGSSALLMLQHLTGGAWGLVIRRPLEAGTRLIPFMAVLFLPIAFGMEHLYVWTHDPHARGVGVSALRAYYLQPGFFLCRAGFYFAVWMLMGFLLTRWSRLEDRLGHASFARRFQILSAGGIVLYGLTMTFAAVDWAMTLTPGWYSTIWGAILIVGQVLTSIACAILLVILLSDHPPLSEILGGDVLNDLGNLLLAFVMLWAYLAFSQYLIIWSANTAHETPYYAYRSESGWQWLALFLIVFHFFVPFLVLLSRWAKRKKRLLGAVALSIIIMRFVDLFWVVQPSSDQTRAVFPVPGFRVHWLDFAAPVGIGGVSIAAYLWQLGRLPLLPLHDPRLEETERHD